MRRHKRFLELPRILEAFVRDLRDQAVDLTAFTGDITAVSYPDEFAAARRHLAELLDGERVIGIPGNHDVYIARAGRERPFEAAFPDWIRSDRPDLVDEDPYPIVRLLGDEAAVIAINSARPCALNDSSGLVGPRGLGALDRALDDPELRARRKIVALHYGPRLADGRPDKPRHGLRDAEELLEILGERGVDLTIHGHLHERFILPAGGASPVALANTGSLTDARHHRCYHIYELKEEGIAIAARRYDPAQDAFVPWTPSGARSVPYADKPTPRAEAR